MFSYGNTRQTIPIHYSKLFGRWEIWPIFIVSLLLQKLFWPPVWTPEETLSTRCATAHAFLVSRIKHSPRKTFLVLESQRLFTQVAKQAWMKNSEYKNQNFTKYPPTRMVWCVVILATLKSCSLLCKTNISLREETKRHFGMSTWTIAFAWRVYAFAPKKTFVAKRCSFFNIDESKWIIFVYAHAETCMLCKNYKQSNA